MPGRTEPIKDTMSSGQEAEMERFVSDKRRGIYPQKGGNKMCVIASKKEHLWREERIIPKASILLMKYGGKPSAESEGEASWWGLVTDI